MKKLLIIPLLLVSFLLSAAPIGEKKAREIAMSFFAAGGVRSVAPVLSLEWAGDVTSNGVVSPLSVADSDEAILYIYNRADAQGFVVVAGDDKADNAIIAFSHNNNLLMSNLSEGARFMLTGWSSQIKASRAGQRVVSRASDDIDVGTIQKLYETASWNQAKPFNNETPLIDGQRAVTGCMATTMSIICHYHKWPECGVGTTPAYKYRDITGVVRSVPENILGHSYDYANMRIDNYTNGYSDVESSAVATLMKDTGTAVKMQYHYETSSAYGKDALIALSTYFGYSKAAMLVYGDGYAPKEWRELLKENIAQYGPTIFCGVSNTGGHAFILDGYTSAGYYHINYGWGGVDNGYYLMPDIIYSGGQNAIFYLEPDKEGTSSYQDDLLLVKYKINNVDYVGLSSSTTTYAIGKPFEITFGCVYNAGNVEYVGDIAVALCDKDGAVKEILFSDHREIKVNYIVGYKEEVKITTPINNGDRLRVVYKSEGSNEWKWVKSAELGIIDELVIPLMAEDIAKSLRVKYDSSTKILHLSSLYDNISFDITGKAGSYVVNGQMKLGVGAEVDISSWPSGEYQITLRRDTAEYKLDIVL